jgi:hypothetical protein
MSEKEKLYPSDYTDEELASHIQTLSRRLAEIAADDSHLPIMIELGQNEVQRRLVKENIWTSEKLSKRSSQLAKVAIVISVCSIGVTLLLEWIRVAANL